MRVVVPIVSSSQSISGVPRHAINMVRSLLLSKRIEHVHLIAGEWQEYVPELLAQDPRLSLQMVSLRNDVISRNLWYSMKLARIVREQKANIVHYSFPAPVLARAFGVSVVVTLHDLYPYDLPENFGYIKAPFNRMILHQSLTAATAIACVSRTTRDRLERIDPLLALRSAHVVPNCVEPPDFQAKVPVWLNVNVPFVLCVAQHRRNKNLIVLLRAFVHLRARDGDDRHLRLLIVGMDGPETEKIKRFIVEQRLQDSVLLKSGLPEEELRWCYESCVALVAPSVVEGFGLPVVEALMHGCRVVCSDIPAFREVGGPHCRYVHINEDSSIRFAHAIADALVQPKPKPIALPLYSRAAVSRLYEELYCSITRVHGGGERSLRCSTTNRIEKQVQV